MELIQGKRNAPKLSPVDFISTMPDNVVTNIMDRLPLQDAVRTSILAKYWRFKWTMLSQLILDSNFFIYLLKTDGDKKDHGRIISRLLLHIKGAITKFVLHVDERCKLDDEDISHWLLVLSNKGVNDMTLWNKDSPFLKLPTHLFSCLQLKHLKLVRCCFGPSASFHGFPNLLSLEFSGIVSEVRNFGEIFSKCPVLEILSLWCAFPLGKVKAEEMAKLAKLKTLSLLLISFEHTITSLSSIFELVGSLPNLQELHLDLFNCYPPTEEAAGTRSPTAFPCLKSLKLTSIDLGDGIMLSRAFEMIRCFRNLHTLEINACNLNNDSTPAVSFPEVDCNTMGPLQLRSVVFKNLEGSENEVCFIKYLLACSPFLKKIVIRPNSFLVPPFDEKLFARKLLKLHRASPTAEINLY